MDAKASQAERNSRCFRPCVHGYCVVIENECVHQDETIESTLQRHHSSIESNTKATCFLFRTMQWKSIECNLIK